MTSLAGLGGNSSFISSKISSPSPLQRMLEASPMAVPSYMAFRLLGGTISGPFNNGEKIRDHIHHNKVQKIFQTLQGLSNAWKLISLHTLKETDNEQVKRHCTISQKNQFPSLSVSLSLSRQLNQLRHSHRAVLTNKMNSKTNNPMRYHVSSSPFLKENFNISAVYTLSDSGYYGMNSSCNQTS